MSKFALFMKQNKEQKNNEKYAPTTTLKDENGKPVEWEFRHITSKENDALREAATIEVPVTGKPGVFRPKVIANKYMASVIVAATVFPDLYDAELQDSYGVKTPEDLLYALVDDAGEYQRFGVWMQKFQGFTKSFDEQVEEAKN